MTELPSVSGVRGPRLRRAKTSEAVVAYIVRAMLAGELRAGERIDIDLIGERLGVSRIPVREALLLMERDGLVDTRYHRGVHVGQFDEEAIRYHFRLYGILGGVACDRFATRPATAAQIAELEGILVELEALPISDLAGWETRSRDFLRVVFTAAAGPRLRSMLASFSHFVPYAYEIIAPVGNTRALQVMHAELAAIKAADGERVCMLFEENMRSLAELVVAELSRREVFTTPGDGSGRGDETGIGA